MGNLGIVREGYVLGQHLTLTSACVITSVFHREG